MEILHNHISVTSELAIKEICKTLFQNTEITYFIYVRFYLDSTCLSLPSNNQWHRYFWNKNYHHNTNSRLIPGTHLWDSNKKFSPPSNDAREFFNIDNRLDIVTHHGEYYEVFGFGSNRGNTKILDLYLNKIEKLKQFTFYFKEMAGPLLKESQKPENRLLIDNIKIYRNIEKELTTDPNSSKKLSIFNIRQFKFSNFSLSKRELETLALTLRGRSAAEISSILNISSKTVESYLENAKHKFRCANRAELFDKCYDIGVIDFAKNISWLKKYR
jgi:DNA-binding CsgD family transcriptional regulator